MAQQGAFAIRYQGTLTLGGSPAAGMEVIVITARTATDTNLCGRTTTTAGGRFTVDIPRDPNCVAPTRGPVPTWYFLANGEMVDMANRGIFLDQPNTLGQTRQTVLAGKTIPGISAPAGGGATPGMAGGQGPRLNAIRYYGVLTLGDGAARAPQGTAVTVRGMNGAVCATNRVLDDQGHYYLDIPATPSCAAATIPDPPVGWSFEVNGATVQRTSRGVAINEPNTLAGSQALNLNGPLAPVTSCPIPLRSSGSADRVLGTAMRDRASTVQRFERVYHTQDVYLLDRVLLRDGENPRDVTEAVVAHAATAVSAPAALEGGFTFRKTSALTGVARDRDGVIIPSITVDAGLLSVDAEAGPDTLVVIVSADLSQAIRNLTEDDSVELDLAAVPGLEAGGDGAISYAFVQTLMPADLQEEIGLEPIGVFARRWSQRNVQAAGVETDGEVRPILVLDVLNIRPREQPADSGQATAKHSIAQPGPRDPMGWAAKTVTVMAAPFYGSFLGTLAFGTVGFVVGGLASAPLEARGLVGTALAARVVSTGIGAAIGSWVGYALGFQQALSIAESNSPLRLAQACG